MKRLTARIASAMQRMVKGQGLRSPLPRFDDSGTLDYVRRKSLGLKLRAPEIETLVIGSSHADYGFDPAHLPGSYNASLTSCDLHTARHIYANVAADLAKLKTIILFVSVFTPGFSLIRTSERYRAVAHRHFFGVPYQQASLIDRRIEARILSSCGKPAAGGMADDYAGYSSDRPYFDFIAARDRAKNHLRENRRKPDQLRYLAEIIDRASENGVATMLVIPPFRSDYIAHLPAKEELFGNLGQYLAGRGRLVDFYASPLFDDGDMGDADHLNPQGAAQLARLLGELIG